VRRGAKFFIKCGLGEDTESITGLLMRTALSMSSAYHTPVDFWLAQPIEELHDWVAAASVLAKENR
jgi:hypothetical protein